MYMENLNMWYFVLNILDKFEKVFSKLFMDVHFQTIGFIHRLLRSEGTSVWVRIRILGYLRKSKSVCYNNSFHLSSEPNEYVENGKCTFKICWKIIRAKADRERGSRSSSKSRFPEEGRSASKCRSNWVSQRSSTRWRETPSRFDSRLGRISAIHVLFFTDILKLSTGRRTHRSSLISIFVFLKSSSTFLFLTDILI